MSAVSPIAIDRGATGRRNHATARSIEHWLAQAWAKRDARYRLDGQGQMDDAFLCGELASQCVPLIPQPGELF